ncbi:hypothetical protein OHT52_00995 [Streptomyces sp. NBC_00247]|nr:hypothetical protein [Streptomyces sp. NBC_00247]
MTLSTIDPTPALVVIDLRKGHLAGAGPAVAAVVAMIEATR